MKTSFILLLLILSINIVSAQKIPTSLNVSYRREIKDFGIGIQSMIPIHKHVYIAPDVVYFFENKNNPSGFVGSWKGQRLNYGANVHYAIYLNNSNESFFSPFLGLEGMTTWSNVSGEFIQSFNWEAKSLKVNGSTTDFNFLGNIGVAGKWFTDKRVFINTQIKYSLAFDKADIKHFTFTLGWGYLF